MTLKEKYHGKRLSTDELAVARTEINKAIQDLEGIEYTTGEDRLLLKWGTWKRFDVKSKKAKELFSRYQDYPVSVNGVLTQRDTPEQKEILCQIVDEVDGIIQNDWDGKYYTKEQAKEYIRNYSEN